MAAAAKKFGGTATASNCRHGVARLLMLTVACSRLSRPCHGSAGLLSSVAKNVMGGASVEATEATQTEATQTGSDAD